jgi:D-alanyl-D-alanine carboxypeptidase/D-alanyl-D-alanine-endopeptidase (penicillin-binding protein 4)
MGSLKVALALGISLLGPRGAAAASSPAAAAAEQAPLPPDGDGDRERIARMQEALREILHGTVLRRMRVGMRVMEARTGRLFFEKRGAVLMDPASNQKVLATATALMRLGADWRFRTELAGPPPSSAGVIAGDVVLRGSGDPTVTSADLEAMAARLAQQGVTRVEGAVVADPRRIGADEPAPDAGEDDEPAARASGAAGDDTGEAPLRKLPPRAPLVVDHGIMLVRVRPGDEVGARAEVTTNPADRSFVILNRTRTGKPGGRSRVSVQLALADALIHVEVSGRIAAGHPGLAFRRRVPHQALYAAVLLRAALEGAGIAVRDTARVGSPPRPRAGHPVALLERHESVPLGILLRKINKDSDNDYAERVLEAAGAEVYGGAPTPDKGVRLLRDVIGELGLPPGSYIPKNGSGLGHANRITAAAMADLLRTLYLDPRIGPEILQSLSVGGVDGTTRNRFKGTLAARRVRAKTGTLRGKSVLSGLVGDGPDVVVFSILVEGLRHRTLAAVRGAQVGCVNAMMRYVREAQGARLDLPAGNVEPQPNPDFETGGELVNDEGMVEGQPAPAPAAAPAKTEAAAQPPPKR